MPVEPITYYRVVCDVCRTDLTDACGHDYSAWADAGYALDEVREMGGMEADGWIVCNGCLSPYHASLSDDRWDALYDENADEVKAMREHFAARADTTKEDR